jgi:uncharacterized membrane protein
MNLQDIGAAIEATPVGDFVASSSWAFPTIETVHVISLVLVFGTVAIMDLRLLGLASRSSRMTEIEHDVLPFTWGAFVMCAITGTLLFVSKAHIYVIEPWFIAKMCLILLAGINMAVFHHFTWRRVGEWDSNATAPLSGKIAGALSILIWILVVACAREIGFTLGLYE